ncbi:MAG: twin-arginine translocation signal domain-containing protein, partial [Acidobacteriaceae bacterium]|nr:twin-arginine translocation signal domain-containing protein [Acidobacteriaceae bacterium]
MNTHNAAQTELSAESRRDFLRTTATGGLLLVSSQTAFTYQANSTVELGLLGCGSR